MWGIALAALVLTACAPNPARAEAVAVLDTLDSVHLQLTGRKPVSGQPCSDVGGARGKLYAVVGRSDLPAAWQPLSDATDALEAACGQLAQLNLPANDDALLTLTRAEWRQGAQQQLSLACEDLRTAAARLDRPAPSCQP